jgi:hypothetical protein
MNTKWTILILFFTISNSFGATEILREARGLEPKLKTCQTKIKELCGKEEGLDKILKCIKSHQDKIPKGCIQSSEASFNK